MPEILLTTLNAKYIHASFGLRYLLANLGALAPRAAILEFDINQRTGDILEQILAAGPRVVGFGVYIWNVRETTELVAALKRVRPEMVVVAGGPEVSHEVEEQAIFRMADYVITGEADLALAGLCAKLLEGRRPLVKIIPAELPEFSRLVLPYARYTAEDIRNRVIYVEASRGCPFKCEFCLSSLDVPVRNAPLEPFLSAMRDLLDRGVRQFKFVDRTFNLNLNIGRSILQFFLDRYTPGLFLHFEMIPDRLPDALRQLIARFPPGALQFEVGIQTFNEAVSERISRRQDNAKVVENLTFLREQTGVHVHADLIVGLPGESLESFGEGFDKLVSLRPQEIQVGILKRLRGTPIVRHDAAFGMRYSPNPPYEILQNDLLDFATLQRMRRFARYWDLVANSGNFTAAAALIWKDGSPFGSFLAFSDWLHERAGRRTHGIALNVLAELLFEHLSAQVPKVEAAAAMAEDFARSGRRDVPDFLRPHVPAERLRRDGRPALPARQARHRGRDVSETTTETTP